MKPMYLIFCIMLAASVAANAQLTAFKAREGATQAIKTASNKGILNGKVQLIGTLGDTTGVSSQIPENLRALVRINFDFSKGTNTLWFYNVKGKNASGNDTSSSFILVKVLLVGFTDFPLPLPAIPGGVFSADSTLPADFMDSDVMCTKLNENSTFKEFKTKYPTITLRLGGLGVSPGGLLGEGPIWSCVIAGRNSSTADTSNISCFVPAQNNTGTAVCFGQPTSVEQDNANGIQMYPNPTSDFLSINVPVELYSPDVVVSVHSLLGEQVARYPITNLTGGAAIVVPTNTLANGTYFITYRSSTLTKTQKFTVSR